MTETFPMTRTCPFDPPAGYAGLRAGAPLRKAVLPDGKTAWLITRYDLVRQLLADPRVSSDRLHENFPLPVPVPREQLRQGPKFAQAMIGVDPPLHSDRRRMVIAEFTVRRIRDLAPRIRQIVDEHIDAILAGPRPADLVTALALPVPSLVICELLGVPYDSRDYFQERTRVLVNRHTPPADRQRASQELGGYLDELVSAKEREPGDDLLGRVITHNRETGVFDHELLIGLAMLLLVAGHETTANMIALGTVALLANPDQLAALRADPALLPGAVEELLRYLTIVEGGFRVALEDISIGGMTIRAGEAVIALGGAANRDESAFPEADRLDITRGQRHHVAFGYGIHQCLGQNLARTELEIVFGTLFHRIPGLRLATPLEDLPFKDDAAVYGVYELPVTW